MTNSDWFSFSSSVSVVVNICCMLFGLHSEIRKTGQELIQ